jgi:hypothetical protein
MLRSRICNFYKLNTPTHYLRYLVLSRVRITLEAATEGPHMRRASSLYPATSNSHARKLAPNARVILGSSLAAKRYLQRASICVFVVLLVAGLCPDGVAQSSLPFRVSNPKHKKWPGDEASRIYTSACELVARTIRPERPPHLHPNFVLVLGSQDNEMVRDGVVSEIHLKNWNPTHFAEAVVLLATREVLKNEDVAEIVRYAVISAQTSVSVRDLRQTR